MTETPRRTAGDGDPERERPLQVLHLDPSEAVRKGVAAAAEAADDLEVRSAADTAAARDALESVDCLVVEPTADAVEWAALLDARPADLPVVIYTDQDPTGIPDDVAAAADSLVQKGNGEAGRAFLLEKVRGATRPGQADGPRFGGVDGDALATERAEQRGVYLIAADGTVEWASQPLEALFPGAGAEADLPTDNLYDHLAVVLADAPNALGTVVGVRGTDETVHSQLLPVPAGEESRYLLYSSYPLPGDTAARVTVFEDLTRAYRDRDRLSMLERMVNSAEDGIYTLDANGNLGYVNRAMADILGYDPETLQGMHAAEVMAPGELQTGQEAIQRLLEDPDLDSIVHDMTFRTRDGEDVEVALHVTPILDEAGNYDGLLGIMRDITERKRREEELERFETIIQALGDPVYALDGDGRYIYVNEAYEDLVGYAPEEVIGQPGDFALREEDVEAAREHIRDIWESGGQGTRTFEVELQAADGSAIPAEIHMSLLPHDGEYRGNAGVIRDITERKRRAQRLEEFTSVVAHDLRSPIAVGSGNLELYRQTGDEARLDKVAGALERMEALVEDLLELAQQGQAIGETAAVDLDSAAGEAWDRVPSGVADLELDSELGTIRADRERLLQLLGNLLSNAADHGGEHPTVTVGPLGAGEGQAGHDRGFYVADDGPGIPPADRDAVFERGFSTTDAGTGFGLAIVRQIVEAHGWEIQLTESEAGGARFEVRGTDRAPE